MTEKDAKELDETAEKINKSLKYSINDASFWSIMVAFGDTYLPAFAMFLKATSLQISILASVPHLLSSFLQLFSVKITMLFKSRKNIVTNFALAQVIMWILILFTSIITKNVWILIILSAIYFSFGSLAGPAWASWMGDLVPENKRGKFFGNRNRISGMVSFVAVMVAGYLLNLISKADGLLAFSVLFSIAAMARLVSYIYLKKKYEPIVELRQPKGENFLKFLKEINKNAFGIFTLYSSFMMFVVFISSPLMVVFWLEVIGFSYLEFTILIAAAAISTFITITDWGAYADQILIVVPLAWLVLTFFYPNNILIYGILLQMINGFAWAGFNLSSGNLQYDTIEPEKRVQNISYHNIIKGGLIFLGGMTGGIIATINISSNILLRGVALCLIASFLGRLIVAVVFLSKIKETKIINYRPHFLHIVTVMPAQGIIFDSIVGMNRTLKKFKRRIKSIESRLDSWENSYKKKTKKE